MATPRELEAKDQGDEGFQASANYKRTRATGKFLLKPGNNDATHFGDILRYSSPRHILVEREFLRVKQVLVGRWWVIMALVVMTLVVTTQLAIILVVL